MNLQKHHPTTKFNRIHLNHQTGMSYIELITIGCIFTILALLAFPSIQSWRQKNEAQELFRKISPTLLQARSSAFIYHTAVSVCGGSPVGCTGLWHEGMLTFTDINHNGAMDLETDHILSYTPLELHFGKLSWRSAGARGHIIYQENGLPLGSNGSLIYCGQEQQYHRSVVLSMMGHTRRSPDRNHDGIYEDTNGQPLVC
jgi:Tfp pilus assembly protein FimT